MIWYLWEYTRQQCQIGRTIIKFAVDNNSIIYTVFARDRCDKESGRQLQYLSKVDRELRFRFFFLVSAKYMKTKGELILKLNQERIFCNHIPQFYTLTQYFFNNRHSLISGRRPFNKAEEQVEKPSSEREITQQFFSSHNAFKHALFVIYSF